mmetsp:Transcript_9757/g.22993  ORF Transcript_9757/g.22993 Transcript_9757/m.22993 type:complete len:107 (-) Transcript_9757:228-548(-)
MIRTKKVPTNPSGILRKATHPMCHSPEQECHLPEVSANFGALASGPTCTMVLGIYFSTLKGLNIESGLQMDGFLLPVAVHRIGVLRMKVTLTAGRQKALQNPKTRG